MSGALLTELQRVVVGGDADQARALTESLLAANNAPDQLLDYALIPAMTEAGRRFEAHEFFLPDLLLAVELLNRHKRGTTTG